MVVRHGARGRHDGRRARRAACSTARTTLPILIHGDAAFPGQGIVAETLNLSRLAGYDTGGTIHIIANNQLGFTADAERVATARATRAAWRAASRFRSSTSTPTIRWRASRRRGWRGRTAQRFQRDFLIDLVGYRRYGHNEGDEPAFTQPLMYQTIAAHPTVRELCARALVEQRRGRRRVAADALVQEALRRRSSRRYASLKPEAGLRAARARSRRRAGAARTAQDRRCRSSGCARSTTACWRCPTGFTVHRKLERGRERARGDARRRRRARRSTGPRPRSWRSPSILADGMPIRLTGEDVERGTFSHRHAVLHDAETGDAATCRCRRCRRRRRRSRSTTARSPRTPTIGFEFGYNIQEPERLVIWEAQYGDFINGAQVILDQFVDVGPRQVGPDAVARAAAAARLRRPGARSTRARAPSASSRPRPTSTCAS